MKKTLLTLLLASYLGAYEKGDIVESSLLKELNMQNNKVYIIDFFASWCGSCKKEIPLISVANEHLDINKAEIIGIDVDKKIEDATKFQNALKAKESLNFRVINDPHGKIISQFAPIGMPTLYYVKNGKVLDVLTGAIDNIDKKILSDLKEFQ